MSNRREFLAAAGLAAVPALAGPAADWIERWELGLAVVDHRFAPSRIVGAELGLRGILVRALHTDDVTGLWLEHVRPLWQSRRAAVGGLTTRAPLFCLEQLAWSFGMRVVHHAEHLLRPDGSVVHAARTGSVEARGPLWPARVAERLAEHRASACLRAGPSCAPLEPAVADGASLLHSWIIAAV